jgi:hypothetical protein
MSVLSEERQTWAELRPDAGTRIVTLISRTLSRSNPLPTDHEPLMPPPPSSFVRSIRMRSLSLDRTRLEMRVEDDEILPDEPAIVEAKPYEPQEV